MILENLFKNLDPIVSNILNKALSKKDISVSETIELLKTNGIDMYATVLVADYLRNNTVGNVVTYVINRNINFTNVCIKRCGFCAFSRDFREEEGYFLPIEEIISRVLEARKFGATEICIQAGLPPNMDGNLYVDICKKIKERISDIHIHAFSPEEILYGATRLQVSIREYLKMLKDAGLDSIPGTAAEILDQKLRNKISPGRISSEDWIKIITNAHDIGIPSTCTMMYGHIESNNHIAKHLETIKNIQKETHGFSEFVPLSFIHTEAPMYNKSLLENIRSGPDGNEVIRIHAVSRIVLNNYIKNIQVSWVKEGPKIAQILLNAGVNDFGGTLINESISTSAGAIYGQLLKPKKIHSIIRRNGKIPAQRNSTYKIIKKYENEDKEFEELELNNVDPEIFGSYNQLVKLNKFKFSNTSNQ
ncbi:MAG: 5-amino-6-(D-ribitylamino)uracil--L-tyrosine 4-hydroxyphenyl transferase CofH [Nitrososphaeraceae archaeon]